MILTKKRIAYTINPALGNTSEPASGSSTKNNADKQRHSVCEPLEYRRLMSVAPTPVGPNVAIDISSAAGATHSLTFTDAAGGVQTISMRGGTAAISFTAGSELAISNSGVATATGTGLELSSIVLTGTDAGSTLRVSGSTRLPVTVTSITDASPMGKIIAPSMSIVDTTGAAVSLDSLTTLVVGNISNANITIRSGSPGQVALTAGTVTNTTLDCGMPMSLLKAASWTTTGTDTITAPLVQNMRIAGDFNSGLDVLNESSTHPYATIYVGGAVGAGRWFVQGTIGTLTVGSFDSTWTGTLGNIQSFTVKSGGFHSQFEADYVNSFLIHGDTAAFIDLGHVNHLHITGNAAGTVFEVETANQIAIDGDISDCEFTTNDNIQSLAGNIQSISARSITDSNFFIGSEVFGGVPFPQNTVFTEENSLGNSTLGSIKVARTFASSNIFANKIGSASLGAVTTDNSGVPFGIKTNTIDSFTGIFSGRPLHASKSVLKEGILSADFNLSVGV